MTLLTFERSEIGGREVARLGAIVIGEVAPNPCGRQVQAWARIFLPEITTRAFPATSIEKAKSILESKTRDWIEAAGLRA